MSSNTRIPASLPKRPSLQARVISRDIKNTFAERKTAEAVEDTTVSTSEARQEVKKSVSSLNFTFKPSTTKPKASRKKQEEPLIVTTFNEIKDIKLATSQHRKFEKDLESHPELLEPLQELLEMLKKARDEMTSKQRPVILSQTLVDFLFGKEDEPCPIGNSLVKTEKQDGSKKVRVYTDSEVPLSQLKSLASSVTTKEALGALFYIYYSVNNLIIKSTDDITRAPRICADERMYQYFGSIFDELTESDKKTIEKSKSEKVKAKSVFDPEDFAMNRAFYLSGELVNIATDDQMAQMEDIMDEINEDVQVILTTKDGIVNSKKKKN